MNGQQNYPPGVTGNEWQINGSRDWETWAESLKVGDRCEAQGALATVTSINEDFVWVRLDRGGDPHPVEWEEIGPVTA